MVPSTRRGRNRTASRAILGASRGRLLDWPDQLPAAHPPDWVLPTAHPSSVLRSRTRDEDLLALVADLRVAATAL
jgi:DNA polymerase